MAERILGSAGLPDSTRQEVLRLAQQLRQPPQSRAPAAPLRSTTASTAGSRGPAPATRTDDRLAPPMLERFGGSDSAHENTP
jgi:hypothetical protein